jgi:uncharacterized protein (TIGR00645 family)
VERIERIIETLIVTSRWLMAPFYLGLIVALGVLLFKFVAVLVEFVTHAVGSSESDIILGALGLVDLALTGSLILIVVYSGYENFVSKIEAVDHPDWPDWMTKVDFTALKQKLLASIVAISAIQVLKAFMNIDKYGDNTKLAWLVGIHMVFVISTLLLAIADRTTGEAKGGDH